MPCFLFLFLLFLLLFLFCIFPFPLPLLLFFFFHPLNCDRRRIEFLCRFGSSLSFSFLLVPHRLVLAWRHAINLLVSTCLGLTAWLGSPWKLHIGKKKEKEKKTALLMNTFSQLSFTVYFFFLLYFVLSYCNSFPVVVPFFLNFFPFVGKYICLHFFSFSCISFFLIFPFHFLGKSIALRQATNSTFSQ